MSDRNLVKQTLRGNRNAYRRLVERYRNSVYGVAISYTNDFDLAEDLAQEAFIRAYYRLDMLNNGEQFGSWLRKIVLNLCKMDFRKRKTVPLERVDVDPDTIVGSSLPPDEALEKHENRGQVLDALKQLSQSDREAVVLYYLDGERIESVGQFMGISPATVKMRLHRARKQLREEITNMAKTTLSDQRLGDQFVNRVDIRTFRDWTLLTDEEIQTTLREIYTKDLAVALKGRGEDIREVEKRTMSNVSERVRGIIRNFWTESSVSLEDIEASQKKILRTIHSLQTTGKIRPSSENQTQQQQ